MSKYQIITDEGFKCTHCGSIEAVKPIDCGDHDFVKFSKTLSIYNQPKKALYNFPGEKYVKDGWEQIPTEVTVFGEDDSSYLYEYRKGVNAMNEPFEMWVGFHKSRLISWLPTQLQLF